MNIHYTYALLYIGGFLYIYIRVRQAAYQAGAGDEQGPVQGQDGQEPVAYEWRAGTASCISSRCRRRARAGSRSRWSRASSVQHRKHYIPYESSRSAVKPLNRIVLVYCIGVVYSSDCE